MKKIQEYILIYKGTKDDFNEVNFMIKIGFFQKLIDEFNLLFSKNNEYVEANYYNWVNSLISTTYYITNALNVLIKDNFGKNYDYPEAYKIYRRIRKLWTHPITNYEDNKNEMTSPQYIKPSSVLPKQIQINKYEYFPNKKVNKLKLKEVITEKIDIICLMAIEELELKLFI